MPAPIYRHASRKGGTLLLLLFLGIAGQVGVIWLVSALGWSNRVGAWMLPLACAPLVMALVWGMQIFKRDNHERLAVLGQRLVVHDFALETGADLARKQLFCAPLAAWFPAIGRYGLRGTGNATPAAGIDWFALKQGPVPVFLFEHEFVTGTSKSAETHLHTVLAWPAGHPDIRDRDLATGGWSIIARFPKILAGVSAKGGNAEAAFTALYDQHRISHDPATARRFLTPGVIAELQQAPMPETWYLGTGWILCVFGASLDGDNIDPFLHHARAVVAATG